MWSWTVVYSKGGIIDPRDYGVYPMFLCGSEKEFQNLLSAMTETGWLDPIEGGLLQVHDWDEHTGRVLEERTNERLKKQKQRLEKSACPGEDVRDSPVGQIGDSPVGQNPIVPRQIKQNKIKQNKTKRNSEEVADVTFPAVAEATPAPPRKRVKKSVENGTPGSQVWGRYSAAMESVYGQAPASSAAGYSMTKKLVEMVGVEKAMGIAEIYPHSKNPFYIQRGHPLELLLRDYMAFIPMLDYAAKAPERDHRAAKRAEAADEFFESLGL
jgi:hypothetical protein